jgi:hypothetical protein
VLLLARLGATATVLAGDRPHVALSPADQESSFAAPSRASESTLVIDPARIRINVAPGAIVNSTASSEQLWLI